MVAPQKGGECDGPGKCHDGAATGVAIEGEPLLLRRCISPLATLSDVYRCQAVNSQWSRLSQEEKWVKHCVLSGGVDAAERPGLWRYLAGVADLKRHWCEKLSAENQATKTPAEFSGEESLGPDASRSHFDCHRSFEVLASSPLPEAKISEIERDVHRTFPTHPRFKGDHGTTGRHDLLKVLRAIVVAEPGVGYCQGMNFMAAVLLIHLGGAQDAFWMLLAMIEGYHFRHVFAPGVPLLPLRIFQFSGVVREHLPKLWRHLQVESFSLDIFAHQCVITLFAYCIEPDFLAHVWDVFFFLGWKAVFRIGLGLLAALESRLLDMNVEEISCFVGQCKRHFDPELAGSSHIQGALGSLLRFKVSRATLDSLQRAFQLERWQVLLDLAGSGAKGNEPLPAGLERSRSGAGFVLDTNALSTENLPPWRLNGRGGSRSSAASPQPGSVASAGDVGRSCERGGGDGPKAGGGENSVVKLEALRGLRTDLQRFDEQTQRDAALLRGRVEDVDRELAVLTRDTDELRGEVEQYTLEHNEGQDYKKALMDAIQVAVKTSPDSAERRFSNKGPDGAHSPGQDELVRQCLGKLNRLESDLFEKDQQWLAKKQELEPLTEQIEELREVKTRVMSQFLGFVEGCAAERQTLLEAGLDKVLLRPAASPNRWSLQ